MGGDCLRCHQPYEAYTDHRENPEDPQNSCRVYNPDGKLVRVTRRTNLRFNVKKEYARLSPEIKRHVDSAVKVSVRAGNTKDAALRGVLLSLLSDD